jgi:hypothetical protein
MDKIFILVLLLFLCFACSKEQVDIGIFKTENTNEFVAVEGFASTYFGNQYLQITKSAGVQTVITKPVLDADVVVYSNDTLIQYHLHDTTGVYCSDVPFAIKRGTKYTCKVLVDDKEYWATDSLGVDIDLKDTLFPISAIEDISFGTEQMFCSIKTQNFGFDRMVIYLLGHNGIESDYFNKNLDVGYYVFQYKMHYIYRHEGSLPQGIYAYGGGNISRSVYKESYFDYFFLDISDAYASFLTEYMNITEWSDGIFSTVPGNANSNVSEGGTGYFFVTDLKRINIGYEDFIEMLK